MHEGDQYEANVIWVVCKNFRLQLAVINITTQLFILESSTPNHGAITPILEKYVDTALDFLLGPSQKIPQREFRLAAVEEEVFLGYHGTADTSVQPYCRIHFPMIIGRDLRQLS
jgi:hypothetical protein